jgi:hypothetical protein
MKFVISIVLGFLIAHAMVRYFNFQTHGPDSNIVRKEIHQDQNGKCYHFEPVPYICGI